ncbi:hypothetical protein GAP32_454 [Cronobacter phage vB_CsaM_GAP32]|uniref:Uncharacterized protein n=1 Tax=Cronobacter phage vB_CsaM_GAP32 TaxID=1141136 RepID=K4F6L6_9CAUD|nr:hypothetical protein GAP32_454 [Cronobacter phage vB_CsaM_GAP32]AFC21911.1 hypothetical protein GAP32_454 [Cronobacter phage vB_CsaM_GAP32]
MLCKIKSTLNFVKIWPTEGRREDTPFVILSDSQENANAEVSKVVETWNSIEKDNAGNIVYQCYLKNVKTEAIYIASSFKPAPGDVVLDDDAVLRFITTNKVYLVPDDSCWVDENGNEVNWVTHKVMLNNDVYSGMSVQDCINTHINKK